MKKIIGLVLVGAIVQGWAFPAAALTYSCSGAKQSCNAMGYAQSETDCKGYAALRCPWDETFFFCDGPNKSKANTTDAGLINCYQNCDYLGYTRSKTACQNDFYVTNPLPCPFDSSKYFCGGTLVESKTCAVGDYLYADNHCYDTPPTHLSDNSPIAVVFDTTNKLAVDLSGDYSQRFFISSESYCYQQILTPGTSSPMSGKLHYAVEHTKNSSNYCDTAAMSNQAKSDRNQLSRDNTGAFHSNLLDCGCIFSLCASKGAIVPTAGDLVALNQLISTTSGSTVKSKLSGYNASDNRLTSTAMVGVDAEFQCTYAQYLNPTLYQVNNTSASYILDVLYNYNRTYKVRCMYNY